MELTLEQKVDLLERLVCKLYEQQANGYYNYRGFRYQYIQDLEEKAKRGHK